MLVDRIAAGTQALELASDWFVIMIAIAVFSRHARALKVLSLPTWVGVRPAALARAAGLLLLGARAIMAAGAIHSLADVGAFDLDVVRLLANMLTAIAVIPLFVALETRDDKVISVAKIFHLLAILYAGALAIGLWLYVWTS